MLNFEKMKPALKDFATTVAAYGAVALTLICFFVLTTSRSLTGLEGLYHLTLTLPALIIVTNVFAEWGDLTKSVSKSKSRLLFTAISMAFAAFALAFIMPHAFPRSLKLASEGDLMRLGGLYASLVLFAFVADHIMTRRAQRQHA